MRLGKSELMLSLSRRLNDSSRSLTTSFQRLSSGLRINSAADDPAGLAVATTLRASNHVLNQGIRNINDGISAVNIADSAISALKSLLDRQLELATQAAQGTYSSAQRSAMDTEAQALVSEYNRIVATTKFNGQTLLDGSISQIQIQAGTTSASASRIIIGLEDLTTPALVTTGDGTFQAPQLVSGGGGGGIWNTYLYDLNGDGALDIINAGGLGGLGVAIGNGDGTFSTVNYSVPPWSYVSSISFGDLNGDGDTDLVTSNALDTTVAIWLGNGNGTFDAPTTLSGFGTMIRGVTLADFNNDGNLDIAAGDQSGAATSVWLGVGDGSFGARSNAGAQTVYSMTSADINADGIEDLILGGATALLTKLGVGDGTFQSAVTKASLGGTTYSVQALDINEDGRIDLLATDYSGKVVMLLGNDDGTFAAVRSVAVAGGPTDVRAADLNGDGHIDLAIAAEGANTISIFTGDGTGTFAAVSTTVMPGTVGGFETDTVAIGDINGDGGLDLVAGQDAHDRNYVMIANTHVVESGLEYSLLTAATARTAMTTIESAQEMLTAAQGEIGAVASRLEVARNHAYSTVALQTAAVSRIEDVDVASEVAEMLKLTIRQQAQTALMAHASIDAQIVLSLLK